MSVKTLNVQSTGVFNCVLGNGVELVSVDINDTRIDTRYQDLLQDLVDEMQSQNLQEIHMETTLTSQFVHKVGYENFIVEDNPTSYELFSTMKEWTHRIQEDEI